MDPVYETLRYGTSLALMNRSSFSSTSESPTRSLVCWAQKGSPRGGYQSWWAEGLILLLAPPRVSVMS